MAKFDSVKSVRAKFDAGERMFTSHEIMVLLNRISHLENKISNNVPQGVGGKIVSRPTQDAQDGAFCPVCDIQPTSEGICPKCRRVVRPAANASPLG